MQDRFKFRAKRLDNNKFVYGYLCFIYIDNEKHCKIYSPDDAISYDCYTETLGQCTGLKDRNGTLIYEGDIIARRYYDGTVSSYDRDVVKYGEFNCSCCEGVYGWYADRADIRYAAENADDSDVLIIGNILENADLLEINDD